MKYKIYKWLHRQIARNKFLVNLAISLKFHCRDIISAYVCSQISSPKDEEAIVECIRLAAPRASIFFDIGANKGQWTDIFLRYAGNSVSGYLYEPLPDLAEGLRQKYKGRAINVYEQALAETPGRAEFFRVRPSTHSSLVHSSGSIRSTVNISTLDTEVKQYNLKEIDYVKIDTEGYDGLSIRGGQEALSRQKIGLLQFEYSSKWKSAGSALINIIDMLEAFSYKVFISHKDGLYTFRYNIFGDDFGAANFIAVSPKWNWIVDKLYKGIL